MNANTLQMIMNQINQLKSENAELKALVKVASVEFPNTTRTEFNGPVTFQQVESARTDANSKLSAATKRSNSQLEAIETTRNGSFEVFPQNNSKESHHLAKVNYLKENEGSTDDGIGGHCIRIDLANKMQTNETVSRSGSKNNIRRSASLRNINNLTNSCTTLPSPSRGRSSSRLKSCLLKERSRSRDYSREKSRNKPKMDQKNLQELYGDTIDTETEAINRKKKPLISF